MAIRGIVKRKQTLTKSTGTKKKTSAKKSKGTIRGTGGLRGPASLKGKGVKPGYAKEKTAPKVSRKRKADAKAKNRGPIKQPKTRNPRKKGN